MNLTITFKTWAHAVIIEPEGGAALIRPLRPSADWTEQLGEGLLEAGFTREELREMTGYPITIQGDHTSLPIPLPPTWAPLHRVRLRWISEEWSTAQHFELIWWAPVTPSLVPPIPA